MIKKLKMNKVKCSWCGYSVLKTDYYYVPVVKGYLHFDCWVDLNKDVDTKSYEKLMLGTS